MMVVNNKFGFGEIVYLLTDVDQLPRMVVAITVCKGGKLIYECYCGTISSKHYEFEMTTEKTVMV